MIENTHEADVIVTLVAAPKKQTWANRVHYIGSKKSTRAAGKLPTGMNAHSGLALACVGAMKSLSQVRVGKKKLIDSTVLIQTMDSDFASAIRAFVSGDRVTTLRSARALWHPLKKSLSRGKILVEVLPEDATHIESLRGWAISQLTPQREGNVALRVFTPQRVSESLAVSVNFGAGSLQTLPESLSD